MTGLDGRTRARNVHVNGVTRARNSCTVLIESTVENYLSPAHTDHYALKKKEQPLLQRFNFQHSSPESLQP